MGIIDVKAQDQYDQLIKSDKPSVVLFSVDWSEECKHLAEVMTELSNQDDLKTVQFIKIGAEDFPEISMKHEIAAAPTTIFFKQGSAVDRVDGVDIPDFTSKCKKLAGASAGGGLEDRLKALINKGKVMVFMKGEPSAPRCGFSKQLVAILNETGVEYKTFDILTDEDVRQGLKTYSDWPTYPQVYINGELIGGLDIIKELLASGELVPTLKG